MTDERYMYLKKESLSLKRLKQIDETISIGFSVQRKVMKEEK
jgi:hypothetical protein